MSVRTACPNSLTTMTRMMSADHKAALAQGRVEGAAVRRYLESLAASAKRGRRPDRDRMKRRLAEIDVTYGELSPVKRLEAAQERIDLTAALAVEDTPADDTEVVEGFIACAKAYGERKGISYAAWREVGVPAATLRAAGIARG